MIISKSCTFLGPKWSALIVRFRSNPRPAQRTARPSPVLTFRAGHGSFQVGQIQWEIRSVARSGWGIYTPLVQTRASIFARGCFSCRVWFWLTFSVLLPMKRLWVLMVLNGYEVSIQLELQSEFPKVRIYREMWSLLSLSRRYQIDNNILYGIIINLFACHAKIRYLMSSTVQFSPVMWSQRASNAQGWRLSRKQTDRLIQVGIQAQPRGSFWRMWIYSRYP